jgi:hypothetical protein
MKPNEGKNKKKFFRAEDRRVEFPLCPRLRDEGGPATVAFGRLWSPTESGRGGGAGSPPAGSTVILPGGISRLFKGIQGNSSHSSRLGIGEKNMFRLAGHRPHGG